MFYNTPSGPKQRFEDSRVDMYQWPLTAIANAKVHNVVAHPHKPTRPGDNVV